MGEYDDIEIRSLHEDLELIKSKATNCKNFETRFVSGANHSYQNREEELANTVLEWVRRITS
jgi:hypothetical protein